VDVSAERADVRATRPDGGTEDRNHASSGSLERAFERFASAASRIAGHSVAFVLAVAVVVAWAISGPLFGFSDTWQLVINTGTTVLTFLMVFLIQSALNRDSVALHLKLDELIRVTNEARDAFMGVEDLDEQQMRNLRDQLTHAQPGNAPEAGEEA
jgi:low affinity Fe/Cu permease